MERRLILLRHAEAASAGPAGDHSRPLTAQGQWDAGRLGRALAARGWVPAAVALSNAVRAVQTWERVAPAFAPLPADPTAELYLTGLDAIMGAALSLPAEAQTLLVVGHNPGLEDAASALSGVQVGLRTATAALLRCAAPDWAAAFRLRWELVGLARSLGD
jgi:phosphohistidine phosphatase